MNDISEKTATTKPPTDSTLVLRAEGLQYSYGVRVKAVDNVSLEVAAGEFVAVHGPSGCGKSTLLFLLGGLLEPDAGSVHVAGSQLTGLPPNARARLRGERIGFVFQRFHLIPYLSVRDNVLAAGLALGSGRGKDGDHTPNPASRPPQRADRANDLLARLGLADRASHLPSELSVGEQQRTALARALFLEPPLLLADEPTGNLDPENRDRLLAELKGCAASGQAVVMVSHDEVAIAAASRRLPMVEGHWAHGKSNVKNHVS